MPKTAKKKRPPLDQPTTEEIRLRNSRLRLQRITRDQRAIMAMARKLMKQAAATQLALSVLASSIAEEQGFKIVPYEEPKAINA